MEVPNNGITCLPNYIKIYLSFQKILGGHRETDSNRDRQTDDLISLLSFLGSRLIKRLKGIVG
jgi:hypothetical protein